MGKGLVLARHVGERIVIAEGSIVIELLEAHRGRARFSIIAPRDIDVHREEVYEQLQLGLPKLTILKQGADDAEVKPE